MKTLLLLIIAFLSTATLAQSQPPSSPLHVNCMIQEFVNSQLAKETGVSIDSSSQHHGAMIFPKLSVISEVDMMIALHEGLLIVSLYHNPSGISSASHSDITGGKNAHSQINLGDGRSVTVNCLKD